MTVLMRDDKETPNSSDVIRNVLKLSRGESDDHAGTSRRITDVCFKVRQSLYNTAFSIPGVNLLVDVGTGSGQALTMLTSALTMATEGDTRIPLLMIEPDATSCRLLADRLPRSDIAWVPGSPIAQYVKSIITRGQGLYIMQCSLHDLLNDLCVLALMERHQWCFLECFTMSYVSQEISALSLRRHHVIGCRYVYDATDDNAYAY